jgi:hypothetical protein
MAEFMKTGKSTPADAGAQLPNIGCPALVIRGTYDPDFADPRAEGDGIVAAMSSPGLVLLLDDLQWADEDTGICSLGCCAGHPGGRSCWPSRTGGGRPRRGCVLRWLRPGVITRRPA